MWEPKVLTDDELRALLQQEPYTPRPLDPVRRVYGNLRLRHYLWRRARIARAGHH